MGAEVSFGFEESAEGWSFGSVDSLSTPDSSVEDGSVNLIATNNANCFGFWESPDFTVVDEATDVAAGGRAIRGLTGTDSLYRTTFVVRTGVADASQVPTLRVRSSSFDFQQSDVIVATSVGDGSYSPTAGGATYVQYFTQPEGQNQFRLNFDLLNFDPTDAAAGNLELESVVVEGLDRSTLVNEQAVASFAFADNANGFTYRSAGLADPTATATGRGLELVGSAAEASTTFGYWGIETDVPFVAGRLYQIAFTVSTPATVANRDAVPTFRLRYNDSSLKASGYINIESVNPSVRVPVDNTPTTYFLYIATPPQVVGNTWIFSFDFLHVPGAGDSNDPTIPVTLENLEVKSFDVP